RGAADGVARRAAIEHHAEPVAHRVSAADVCADVVALDHVAGGCRGSYRHTSRVVARDDVTGPGRGAADRGVWYLDDDAAVLEVVQGGGAVRVQADDVALDDVARARHTT